MSPVWYVLIMRCVLWKILEYGFKKRKFLSFSLKKSPSNGQRDILNQFWVLSQLLKKLHKLERSLGR